MTYKEAKEYLQPVADTCVLPQYAAALEMALEALDRMESVGTGQYGALAAKLRSTKSESKRRMLDEAAAAIEDLERELAEERYRHDRYVDYAVERDKMIDRLKEDLRQSGKNDPCDYCKHNGEQPNCKNADYICDQCPHGECRCHGCRDFPTGSGVASPCL